MFNAPRGTKDVLPDEQKFWRFVERKAAELSRRYGFRRLDTPVFEDARLFTRSVGEGTDIVEKETYTFLDRGGDALTLRPEGTAPVCRAYLEHGMHNLPQPVRLYYFCPVYRYDRPQAGRYRQHHQFGVEVLGDADPLVDAEVVQMAWTLMDELGLKEVSLLLNSIGDSNCRPAYIRELNAYYSAHRDHLCSDCQHRLDHNPLRLLDCKRKSCQPLQEEAPASADHLCQECHQHWDQLRRYLEAASVPYRVDHRLVRGLDYYTRTVFEVQPSVEGAQSTLLGGGRYDSLIEQLGGRPTPGIGFATGMERLILNLQRHEVEVLEEEAPRYLVATMDEKSAEAAIELVARIRQAGIGAILGPRTRSLRGQLRSANSLGVPKVIIFGEEELAAETLTLRDMADGNQKTIPMNEFLDQLG